MFSNDLGLSQDLINAVKAITEASCSSKKMEKEELHPNQVKLDKNKNGKLDADDFKKLRKEDAEQIDELSKKTLGSYAKKAADERAIYTAMAVTADNGSNNKKEFSKNAAKRGDGLKKAIDKLTKEQVEEIEMLAAKHGLGE
jgi:hypothetical protein